MTRDRAGRSSSATREDAPAEDEERAAGWFGRLRDSLTASRQALTRELLFDPGDEEAWERIEEALIAADCGVRATVEIVRAPRGARADDARRSSSQGWRRSSPTSSPSRGRSAWPSTARRAVVLVVGVNGTGKTTTIGKLAYRLQESGRSVVLAAADTFRAAAEEQLEIWAGRAGADFVGSQRGADPAAVAFDAISAAEARGRDVVVVDTAGRLHTQTNLMEELAKVRRVIAGTAGGRAARDAARPRRDHRPERPPPGEALRRGRRRHRRRADEAGRDGEGRRRRRRRARARACP